MKDKMKTNPSCDLISRADAIGAIASAEPKDNEYHYYKHIAIKILSEIPSTEVDSIQAEKCEDCIHNGTNKDKITCKECTSIEVEPKWTCTTNFIAEQLERLKNMTDEERLKLLQTMFSSIEADSDDKLFKYKLKGDIVQSYEIVPSIEAVQGWIPCSEKLPSEDDRYLVTYPLMNERNWISIKWFGKPNMPNRPIKEKCFYESHSEYGDVIWDNVVAWMPLPTPYEGGDSE